MAALFQNPGPDEAGSVRHEPSHWEPRPSGNVAGADSRPSFRIAGVVFVSTLVLATLVCCIVDGVGGCSAKRETAGETRVTGETGEVGGAGETDTRPSALASLVFPTPREDLFDEAITNAFIATNASVPETALYGSARTGTDGRPRFHKGIDIAPVLPRARNGEPTDPVRAIADGSVLYVNRIPGNSSYGCYVVLLHHDPVGEVYSLYAHLASVRSGLRTGDTVKLGEEIGVLGRTAIAPIKSWNAHLHFETGLMHSSRFAQWEKDTKQKPLRGNGHGWNLLAADPREVLRMASAQPGSFSLLAYLQARRPACTLVLHAAAEPDYFRRYAPLWSGAPVPRGGADIVLGLTDSGLILTGRLATAEESVRLAALSGKGARVAVLDANPELLGRNGMRIVVQDKGEWRFGTNPVAQRWLELLLR